MGSVSSHNKIGIATKLLYQQTFVLSASYSLSFVCLSYGLILIEKRVLAFLIPQDLLT